MMIVPTTYKLELSDTEMDNLVWLLKTIHQGESGTASQVVYAGEFMREFRKQGVPIRD